MPETTPASHLTDRFQRRIEYVRLSVTDRCDLRCQYCLPKGFSDFEEPDNWLNFDEITQIIRVFAQLGTRRVRITGGEPLVRKDVTHLIQQLGAIDDIDDLSLSTNATRLAKSAPDLAAAGISRINVSLDTLREDRFQQITQGKLHKVMAGLMAAKAAGLKPIKINMVVMRGINDDEVEDMVAFCIEHGFTLRFIETMPVGQTGRMSNADHYVNLQSVKQRLQQQFELIPGVMAGGGPARYFNIANTDINIGFITPISQHFCDTCNRVRLGVDGMLYLCLGQDHAYDLRTPVRQGISDTELADHIRAAIALKPERHEFNEKPEQIIRFMSKTGG